MRLRTRAKYGNRKTTVDGLVFDSKREAARWQELQLLERAGEIRNLTRQVPIVCEVNGLKICKYLADFQYQEHIVVMENGPYRQMGWREVTEDAKGVRTPLYRLKAKLMQALHGITIREV